MYPRLTMLSTSYLNEYTSALKSDNFESFKKLGNKSDFSSEDFEYYLIASSLYSSKIEGNTIDANSFFRNRSKKDFPKKKEIQEIEDLVDAYKFASENSLDKINFLKSHHILSQTFLSAKLRGKTRKEQVAVRDASTLKPIYIAVEPQFVEEELNKLFDDISLLLTIELSETEIFYFASMIHLWLAKIHPFMDGNGRSARLLEKWFIASKLGINAWSIQSEKFYWDHRPNYYQNISLGYNYYALHWERSIPFLLMLPQALIKSIP
jgi:Fic family protein